eukprot:2859682-Rhodomonas_salina.1
MSPMDNFDANAKNMVGGGPWQEPEILKVPQHFQVSLGLVRRVGGDGVRGEVRYLPTRLL